MEGAKVVLWINLAGHEKEDCEGLPKGEDAEVRFIFGFIHITVFY